MEIKSILIPEEYMEKYHQSVSNIIIIIKGIYIAQVRKGHKCAMSLIMTNTATNTCKLKLA